ncbi:unnamed protein product [Parajaminaea phylloscopi]
MQDADGDTRMMASSHAGHYSPTSSHLPPPYAGHNSARPPHAQSSRSPQLGNSSLPPGPSSSSHPFPAYSNGALFAAHGGSGPGAETALISDQQRGSPGKAHDKSSMSFQGKAAGSVAATSASETPKTANAALLPATQPTVYLATYSNVPVFEITVRGIAVMRRRADGYLNATQILKVAGVEKAKRTKILEREILTGEHEKVQGGYGKYQGTWIPLPRAQELAATYNVAHLLRAVLEFDPRTAESVPTAGPKKRPNPNAPANSTLFKGAAGSAKATPGPSNPTSGAQGAGTPPSRAGESATPTKGPSQQPRFLQLRAPSSANNPESPDAAQSTASTSVQDHLPPGSASLISALSATAGEASVSLSADGIPPGSTSSMREALSGYSQYGYTPQGVPLPTPSKGKRAEPDATSVESSDQPSKRARVQEGSPTGRRAVASSSAFALGPSPVKDLAALAGPGSSLRGASHPRLHRVPLGPPDELIGKAGSARFADRPQIAKPQDEGEKRMRDRLVALFMQEDGTRRPNEETENAEDSDRASSLDELLLELRAAISLGGIAGTTDEGGPAPCIDTVIDDHGHSALHWASALCRLGLVKTLVAKDPSEGGANLHAGNNTGETALHRSVLVTNAYDASLFPELLQLLAPSLHTRDFKNRTVLHHIALVAALKGRATPARYYLACLLEYVAQNEGGRFGPLVDAQDEDGETALGIAARQGNNSMVKMLLEVGARKDLANCFGLKPSDWGIDAASTSTTEDQLTPQTRADLMENRSDVVAALIRPPKGPVQKSRDVLEQMRAILDELTSTSDRELTEKTTALQTAQSHLQSATRELTSRRRMISGAQGRVAELEERKIKISNLRKRLARSLNKLEDDENAAPATDAQIKALIEFGNNRDVEGESEGHPDEQRLLPLLVASASSSDNDALIVNRWLAAWYARRNAQLESDTEALSQEAKTTEAQCKRVVAMYSRIEESKVEGILEELVSAVESYSEVDLARVAGFLAKTIPGRVHKTAATASLTKAEVPRTTEADQEQPDESADAIAPAAQTDESCEAAA